MRNYPRLVATVLAAGAIAVPMAVIGAARAQGPSCGMPLFPAQQFALNGAPVFVVAGDLDSDGDADLAFVAFPGVEVLLGNGDGTFGAAASYAAGGAANSIAVDDLDGDGDTDLVVANYGSYPDNQGNVSVLLGNGDGTFAPALSYEAGIGPRSIVIDDFDGDGDADLAVANTGNEDGRGTGVSVLLGNGDGTFDPAVHYAAGSFPVAIATNDLNGDGHTDLAVANSVTHDVAILLNNGDGTFGAPVSYPAGNGPRFITIDDLDGDGDADLVVTSWGDSNIAVLLGHGDGTFARPVLYPAPSAGFLAIEDLDGDGAPDLAVVVRDCIDSSYDYCIEVLRNNGDGTFAAAVTYIAGLDPKGLAIGDFNRDGDADLAIANGSLHGKAVTILLGNGDGTFGAGAFYDLGISWHGILVADLDGDSDPDMVLKSTISSIIWVVLGNGDGTFGEPASYAADSSGSHLGALGDLDGDGDPDLLLGREGVFGVAVFLNNGNGSFGPPTTYFTGSSVRGLAIADLDADGDTDLAVTSYFVNTVSVLMGNNDGTFGSPVTYDTQDGPIPVVIDDLDGDGAADMAVGNANSRTVSVFLNEGDGTFAPAVIYSSGPGLGKPKSLAIDDLDDDGDADLVVAHSHYLASSNHLAVLLNTGEGSFAPAVIYPTGSRFTGVKINDLDGDGRLDLYASHLHNFSVLRGDGDGTFGAAVHYAAPHPAAVTDLDGDGDTDLVAGFASGYLVWLNQSCPKGDLDSDGVVGATDLAILLDNWGPCGDCDDCPGDLDDDCAVGVVDLLILLGNWG